MSPTRAPTSVRPELVEGQFSFCRAVEREELCFDKLSTNGRRVRVSIVGALA